MTFLVLLATQALAKIPLLDRQKRSPFECGFSSKRGARLPVSLRFFLIAVIFLIFDVELVLLFPLLASLLLKPFMASYLLALTFLAVLLLGLLYEWSQGILEWAGFS